MLNKLEVNSAIQGASPCRQLPQRLECPAVIPFQDDLDVWIQFGVAGSDRSDRLGSPMQADGCRLRQLLRNVVRFLGTTFQFNSIQFWSHVLWAETNAGCLTNTEHLILKKKHQRTWQEHQRTSKNIKELPFHPFPVFPPSRSGSIHKSNNEPAHALFFLHFIIARKWNQSWRQWSGLAYRHLRTSQKKAVEQILRFMKCSLLLALDFSWHRRASTLTFNDFSHQPCSLQIRYFLVQAGAARCLEEVLSKNQAAEGRWWSKAKQRKDREAMQTCYWDIEWIWIWTDMKI